jgi:hypothetical protein
VYLFMALLGKFRARNLQIVLPSNNSVDLCGSRNKGDALPRREPTSVAYTLVELTTLKLIA